MTITARSVTLNPLLAAPNAEADIKLKLWAKYSDTDGGLLENVNAYPAGETPQRTLVLIRPDNSGLPRNAPAT